MNQPNSSIAAASGPAAAGFDPAGSRAWVCEGRVMHLRLRPVQHRFAYPVFFCLLPLHALAASGNAFFGVDRWRLLSLLSRDHGPHDGSALLPWFEALWRQHQAGPGGGAPREVHRLWLQAFPRVLGYVFNPVSFWYAYDRHGELFAVLAQVNNTFGEHHNYLIAHQDGRAIHDGDWFERPKRFHVSPFLPVRGHYRFQFRLHDGYPQVRIDLGDAHGELLRTAIHGQARPLDAGPALLAFLRFPLLTLGVLARIHWQAAILYFGKKLPFHSKPLPPIEETTT
jgi:DUF1365 family protein